MIAGVVVHVEQGSADWLAARVGRLTGSRAGALLQTLKSGGEPAARRDLRVQLAVERVIGESADDAFVSRDMQRGRDLEPVALTAYEARRGTFATRVGFVNHPDLLAGCSPDALVLHDPDGDGLVEIKCPKSTTHLSYLRGNVIPLEYVGQCLHNLWITGAAWCDFVSFDPRFPPPLDVFVVRKVREPIELGAYEKVARAFLLDVERDVATLADLRTGRAA